MPRDDQKTDGVRSARKVLRLLLYFDEDQPAATAEQLAKAAGVPLSTTYRYIAALREFGLLEQGPLKTFVISLRVLQLSSAARIAYGLKNTWKPNVKKPRFKISAASLLRAARDGDEACVRALIEKGAEPNQVNKNYGTFPLLVAALNGHEGCVRLLIEKGAEPNQAHEESGMTAFDVAKEGNHKGCMALLRPTVP